MPHIMSEPDDEMVMMEEAFKKNFRYLLKVTDSSMGDFENLLQLKRRTVYRYTDTPDYRDFTKLIGYSVALYQLAYDHGVVEAFDHVFHDLVPFEAPCSFPWLFRDICGAMEIYGEIR